MATVGDVMTTDILAVPSTATLGEVARRLRAQVLVVAVEDRFRVLLDEADAVGARSLADLARLVAARRQPAGAAEVAS